MKIIEGLKKIKELQQKADDYIDKVKTYHADLTIETPMYGTPEAQRQKIAEWLQGFRDITKEILALKIAIQKTNLVTNVDIELGKAIVTKTIAEWIHRRRDLAQRDMEIWKVLNDKNLKEGQYQTTTGEKREVKIRRYYDPSEKDRMIEMYRSEPGIIDRTLEVVNATTDLIIE